MHNIGPLIAFVTSHRWARKYRVHKLMRDELCAPYDNDMMMITKNDGSSLLHQCHIVSLHKKAKQSFILSRPFLFHFLLAPFYFVQDSFLNSFPQSASVYMFCCWFMNPVECSIKRVVGRYITSFPFYSNYTFFNSKKRNR